MTPIIGKVAGVSDQIIYFWQGLDLWHSPYAILDILLVGLIFYWGYLLLKETRAMRILYGIVILAMVFVAGRIFNLSSLNFILKYLITMIIVAIPVVFQPELRSFLEKVGRVQIIDDFTTMKKRELSQVVKIVLNAVITLSKNHVGGLIVLSQRTGLREYIESGTRLDAAVSEDLILSIFAPNTPLHDGAIIISGNKLVAAGCTLPLSEDKFDFTIGTRHRAAAGLSAQSDAIVIVVSEQTGSMSLAYNGILNKDLSSDDLEKMILEIMREKRTEGKKELIEKK